MGEIQNGNQMVQEGALTALASVADSSQVLQFINFKSFCLIVSFLMDKFVLVNLLLGSFPNIL